MKTIIITILCTLIGLTVLGQEDSTVNVIRSNFLEWQPIIEAELVSSTHLYHYAWGENYQENEWSNIELTSEDKILYQKASIIEKPDLGTFVYYDNYALSGDWSIAIDYYFDVNDKLSFVFWRMNTFQADEPSTIEKRLYFNSTGELVRNLQTKYKMNTKEKTNSGFADREVEYELSLNQMDFYTKWKTK